MKLEIFDKVTLERIDIVNKCKYVQYEDQFNDYGLFTLIVPLKEKSVSNLKKGNVIWFEDDVFGIIYYINKSSQNDEETITVRGYTLKYILSYRVFERTYSYNGDVGLNMKNMIDDLIVNPKEFNRKIDFIESENITLGVDKSVQYTGDKLNEAIQDMLATEGYGYKTIVNLSKIPSARISSVKFIPVKPFDRTLNNLDDNNPVIFSFDMDNLKSLEFTEDCTESYTLAYVAGEGEGLDRSVIKCGDESSLGINRRELYVDARDLQSVYYDDDGREITIPKDDYIKKLEQRGLEKLSNFKVSTEFDGSIYIGNKFYKYNEDFFLGDKVTIVDNELNLLFDLQISSVTKTYSNDGSEYFDIKFGKEKMSIRKLLRKGGI